MKILIIITLAFFLIIPSISQPTASDSCIEYNANNSICTKCLQGLYLQYFFCIPCNPLCSCSSNQNYCEACINITIDSLKFISYRSGDICRLCNETIPNCLQCKDGSACTKCFNGMYITKQGTCSNQTCTLNCEVCSSSTQCELCLPGYYLNISQGTCAEEQCTTNCSICASQNSCRVCDNQFYVHNGGCHPCMENCQICLNNQTCEVCTPSYMFVNGSCQSTGQDNCIEYTGGFESPTCLVCEPGYYNAGGSCTQCSGCLLCTQSFLCQTPCLQGFEKFNYACLQFQKILYACFVGILGTLMILM